MNHPFCRHELCSVILKLHEILDTSHGHIIDRFPFQNFPDFFLVFPQIRFNDKDSHLLIAESF